MKDADGEESWGGLRRDAKRRRPPVLHLRSPSAVLLRVAQRVGKLLRELPAPDRSMGSAFAPGGKRRRGEAAGPITRRARAFLGPPWRRRRNRGSVEKGPPGTLCGEERPDQRGGVRSRATGERGLARSARRATPHELSIIPGGERAAGSRVGDCRHARTTRVRQKIFQTKFHNLRTHPREGGRKTQVSRGGRGGPRRAAEERPIRVFALRLQRPFTGTELRSPKGGQQNVGRAPSRKGAKGNDGLGQPPGFLSGFAS